MVGMGAGHERIVDGCFCFDPLTDGLERPFGGRAAKIEADDGQLVCTRLDHQRHGVERIERSGRERIMARAVAPHGHRFFWGDVALAYAGFEDR